jgi:hypothetical protein
MDDNGNKSKGKDRERDILVTDEDNSKEKRRISITNTSRDITNVGDTGGKIIDTGDISIASIAKGIRGLDDE